MLDNFDFYEKLLYLLMVSLKTNKYNQLQALQHLEISQGKLHLDEDLIFSDVDFNDVDSDNISVKQYLNDINLANFPLTKSEILNLKQFVKDVETHLDLLSNHCVENR